MVKFEILNGLRIRERTLQGFDREPNFCSGTPCIAQVLFARYE